jgi:hypothetical protein
MQEDSPLTLTERNLDWLAQFLGVDLERSALADQIPMGAHIFPGSSQDPELTQANLRLASKILLAMALGYVEEAPLFMVYTKHNGAEQLIDLSRALPKKQAHEFVKTFQEENGQRLAIALQQLVAA